MRLPLARKVTLWVIVGAASLATLSIRAKGSADEEQARDHLRKARQYASDFKVDKAAREANEAIRADADTNDPLLAEAHVYLGLPSLRADDLKAAEFEFRRAAELDPDFSAGHCYLGYVLYQKGALDDAVDQLNFAAKLDPNSPQTLAGLGLVQFKLGDRDKAIKTYDRALEYDRRYADLAFLGSEKGPHWTGPMLKDVADLLPLVHKPKYPY